MKSRNSPSVDLPRSRRVVSMASTSTIQISHLGPEPASKEELYKYVLKVILWNIVMKLGLEHQY